MKHTYSSILPLLPKREYWFSQEVAQAFGVSLFAIQRARKNYSLGKKITRMRRGMFVYLPADVEALCKIIQGVPGNKKHIRERIDDAPSSN